MSPNKVNRGVISFFTVHGKSAFMPLRDLYPECYQLIEGAEQLHPMFCMENRTCPRNKGCMDVLRARVDYLFDKVVPQADMLVAYFKYQDTADSLRGVVFTRDDQPIIDVAEGMHIGNMTLASVDDRFTTPFTTPLNPYAFRSMLRDRKKTYDTRKFQWTDTGEFYRLKGPTDIIPVASLIKDGITG